MSLIVTFSLEKQFQGSPLYVQNQSLYEMVCAKLYLCLYVF